MSHDMPIAAKQFLANQAESNKFLIEGDLECMGFNAWGHLFWEDSTTCFDKWTAHMERWIAARKEEYEVVKKEKAAHYAQLNQTRSS